jgi:putative acetyltransferase
MLIQRERPGHVAGIRAVTVAAFGREDEARLVDELRTDDAWLPKLSLVAIEGGEVVGHVLATRGYLETGPALGLGPLSVHPDRQGQGIGSALVHALLGAADALDEPLVVLLGAPRYYARFGFRPATGYGIEPERLQVRTLDAFDPGMRGRFRYPEPFDRL